MSEFFVGFPFLRVDCCGRDVVAVGALYLRYGAEVEACAVSSMIYSYKTRYTLPDGDVAVFRDFMASPFVSLGWRL